VSNCSNGAVMSRSAGTSKNADTVMSVSRLGLRLPVKMGAQSRWALRVTCEMFRSSLAWRRDNSEVRASEEGSLVSEDPSRRIDPYRERYRSLRGRRHASGSERHARRLERADCAGSTRRCDHYVVTSHGYATNPLVKRTATLELRRCTPPEGGRGLASSSAARGTRLIVLDAL
jgi:hypothetical protein